MESPHTRRNELAVCIAAVIATAAPITLDAQPMSGQALPAMSLSAVPFAPLRGFAPRATPHQPARSATRAPLLASSPIVVTSCADDGGFDTLRHAVLTANPGDTIDMTGATCGTITLQSSAISVDISDLTILGPGSGQLTIDANHVDRVFQHNGAGTLALYDLTIANGTRTADKSYGGCIYSKGSVSVNRSVVKSCLAAGQSLAVGGGVFAAVRIDLTSTSLSANKADAEAAQAAATAAAGGGAAALLELQMVDSIVSGNTVKAPSGEAYAGGAFAPSLTVKYSTISGNHAIAGGDFAGGNFSAAGAAAGSSTTTIMSSTIDGNDADVAGALFLTGGGMSVAVIANSTISTNVANVGIGAVDSLVDVAFISSTVAFNVGKTLGGPAIALQGTGTSTVDSTIIADNSPQDLDGGGMIGGGHDLIKIAGMNVTVPTGTITLDPKLGPLQFNGGITRTHALAADSPAIDQGDGTVGPTDQRGPTYRRSVGAAADIGAFELDSDHVFGNAFDLK